jgi:hypothetical protein
VDNRTGCTPLGIHHIRREIAGLPRNAIVRMMAAEYSSPILSHSPEAIWARMCAASVWSRRISARSSAGRSMGRCIGYLLYPAIIVRIRNGRQSWTAITSTAHGGIVMCEIDSVRMFGANAPHLFPCPLDVESLQPISVKSKLRQLDLHPINLAGQLVNLCLPIHCSYLMCLNGPQDTRSARVNSSGGKRECGAPVTRRTMFESF